MIPDSVSGYCAAAIHACVAASTTDTLIEDVPTSIPNNNMYTILPETGHNPALLWMNVLYIVTKTTWQSSLRQKSVNACALYGIQVAIGLPFGFKQWQILQQKPLLLQLLYLVLLF